MFRAAYALRLLLVLAAIAFACAVYLSWSGTVGQLAMRVWAASGGPVDVLLDDGRGRFVFTPSECGGLIGALTRCSSTIEVSNAGATDGVEFEYWIEAWADADGVDGGDVGSRGDSLSSCYLVALGAGSSTGPGLMESGTGASAGPWVGAMLPVGRAESWTVEARVRGTRDCQGTSTTVIIAVVAANDSAVFDEFRTPTPTPEPDEPEPTATAEPDETATVAPDVTAIATPEPSFPAPGGVVIPPGSSVNPPPFSTLTPVTPTPRAAATSEATGEPTATAEPPAPPAGGGEDPPVAEGPREEAPRVGETNFLTERVPGGFRSISRDPRVLATNLSLSVAAVLVVLAATSVFNATLKENADAIHSMTRGLQRPLTRAGRLLGVVGAPVPPTTSAGKIGGALKPIAILGGTGVIYAFMEPSFGWNAKTAVMLVGLLAGIAVTTFLYEGGQVLWSVRRYRSQAAMRIYPIALVVAVASVLLTRVAHLHLGIIFGFVAAAAVVPHSGMGRREHGMIVLMPVLGLLATAVVAFMLIEPTRAYAEAHPSVWGSLPETVAVALFVCGAQGTLMVLVPFTFSDGEKIWAWNKFVWLLVAIPATFLFFHILVNTEGSFEDVANDRGAATALVVSLALLGAAVLMWLYFKLWGYRYAPLE